MFLIAMISLTMSRISSRAESASSLASCAKIDRLDQRAEDRALDLVVGLRAARIDRGREFAAAAFCGRRWPCRRRRPDDRRAEAGGRERRAPASRTARPRQRADAGAARGAAGRGARRLPLFDERRWNYRKWDACQTPTQLQRLLTLAAAAVSRSAATTGPSAVSSAPHARSIAAPAAGTSRRCGGLRKSRRSSARCSPPRRTPAARTE